MMLGLHSCDVQGKCGVVLSLKLTTSILLREDLCESSPHAHDRGVLAWVKGMLPVWPCVHTRHFLSSF